MRLKTEGAKGKAGQTFRYANTHEIGIYLLRLLDAARSAQIAYSVNFDPDEADPAEDRAAGTCKSVSAATPLVFADNPDDLSSTFACSARARACGACF